MNDLMRPALYGSYHNIIPLIKSNKKNKKIHDFVGPVCETTDKFLSVKGFQQLNEKELCCYFRCWCIWNVFVLKLQFKT